jgi:FlaA1/EpsC-like NDP-sugar epimerase
MLKKHSELFKNLLFLSDIVLISFCWVFVYYLRFSSGLIPLYYNEVPAFKGYLYLLVPIIIIWAFIFRAFDLYRPRRISGLFEEFRDIFKACTWSLVILIAVAYVFKQFGYSRLVFLLFWSSSILALIFSRAVFREVLRLLRKKGYNLRHVLIVGDGKLAREVIKRITDHPELGVNVIGLLGSSPERVGKVVHGKKVIGTYDDMEKFLKENTVDQLFIALSFSEIKMLEGIMERVGKHPLTIKVIPDIFHFLPFCGNVEEFEGMAFLTIQGSPLYGWNVVLKRSIDIAIASLALLLTLPLMAVIAVVIKLTSKGPQKRTTRGGPASGRS